jgi:hypothetical protein
LSFCRFVETHTGVYYLCDLSSPSNHLKSPNVTHVTRNAILFQRFSRKGNVSESLSQFTAVAISNRYRLLKAGEMILFFFNFKAGFYERFYSYFDTQTIIRSFKSFLEERALTIAAPERELNTYKGVPQ